MQIEFQLFIPVITSFRRVWWDIFRQETLAEACLVLNLHAAKTAIRIPTVSFPQPYYTKTNTQDSESGLRHGIMT
jgi:hypothetical protein